MKALVIVDVQNDFCPGGALPVPEGDQVVPVINRLQSQFDLVVATQDWHPPNHLSFAVNHGKTPGEVIDLNGSPQVLWGADMGRNNLGQDRVSDELNLLEQGKSKLLPLTVQPYPPTYRSR